MGNTINIDNIGAKHYKLSENSDRDSAITYLCLSYLEGSTEAEKELKARLSEKSLSYIFCNQKLAEAAEILSYSRFCKKCGRIFVGDTKECPVCVRRTNDSARENEKVTKVQPKKQKKWGMKLGIVCVVAVGIGVGIRMNQSAIEAKLPDSVVGVLSKLPFWVQLDDTSVSESSSAADVAMDTQPQTQQAQGESSQAQAETVAISSINLDGVTDLNMQKSGIIDLSMYSNAYSLESLNLYGNPFSDLEPISGLINLKRLTISNSQVYSIEPLAKLVNLEELNFGETQVIDISPVKDLVNLKRIDFWKTSVSDISALSGLTNLEFVSVSYTNVSDLSPLMDLQNLSELGIQGLSISQDQHDEFVSKHPNCTIYDNGTIYY